MKQMRSFATTGKLLKAAWFSSRLISPQPDLQGGRYRFASGERPDRPDINQSSVSPMLLRHSSLTGWSFDATSRPLKLRRHSLTAAGAAAPGHIAGAIILVLDPVVLKPHRRRLGSALSRNFSYPPRSCLKPASIVYRALLYPVSDPPRHRVSVQCRCRLGAVSLPPQSCLGATSILSWCHLDPVSVPPRSCLGPTSIVSQCSVGAVSLPPQSCFGATSILSRSRLDLVSDPPQSCFRVVSAASRIRLDPVSAPSQYQLNPVSVHWWYRLVPRRQFRHHCLRRQRVWATRPKFLAQSDTGAVGQVILWRHCPTV